MYSEAFYLIAQILIALGHAPLSQNFSDSLCRASFPGVDGGLWTIGVNGTSLTILGVPPYHAMLEWNGFPAGIISAQGGIVAAGEVANEDTFCAAARAYLEQVRLS